MNMEKIICNVLIFTIITSVLKGLIIKDEYKQYFQFFCGLIMILIVITPFIDFLSSDNDYYDILQKTSPQVPRHMPEVLLHQRSSKDI